MRSEFATLAGAMIEPEPLAKGTLGEDLQAVTNSDVRLHSCVTQAAQAAIAVFVT